MHVVSRDWIGSKLVMTLVCAAGVLAIAGCGNQDPKTFSCKDLKNAADLTDAAKAAAAEPYFTTQNAGQNVFTSSEPLMTEFKRQVADICNKSSSSTQPYNTALENTKTYAQSGKSTIDAGASGASTPSEPTSPPTGKTSKPPAGSSVSNGQPANPSGQQLANGPQSGGSGSGDNSGGGSGSGDNSGSSSSGSGLANSSQPAPPDNTATPPASTPPAKCIPQANNWQGSC